MKPKSTRLFQPALIAILATAASATMSVAGSLDLSSLTASGFSINLWSLSSILPM